MDRREFLKTTALAAGGLLLARAALGQAEPEPTFSFIALSDPHLWQDQPNEPTGVAKFRKALDAIRALPRKPAFMLMLGDIDPSRLPPPSEYPCPVHPVAGNHETKADRAALRALFPGDFAGRDFYAFTYQNCRFIGLCDALAEDHVGHFESETITPAVGQVEWLEKELDQAQSMRGRFIFGHVPPEQHNLANTMCRGSVESAYFNKLIVDKQVTACFFGHRHVEMMYRVGKTPVYGVPSTNWNGGGKPVGFEEVLVYPNEVKVRFVAG